MNTDLTTTQSTDLDRPPLLDFLSGRLKDAYLKIPPELQNLPEKELMVACYGENRVKNTTHYNVDQKLRIAFWLEYDSAILQNRNIVVSRIYQKITPQSYFFNYIITDPKRFAWITCPPGDFVVDTEALLQRSTQIYYDIFDLPYVEKICRCHYHCVCRPPGKTQKYITKEDCACYTSCICPETINTKLIDSFIKMREAIELRAKGSVPQVIRQTSTSLQLHAKAENTSRETLQSLDDMKKQLADIRAKKDALLNPAIDVTPQPEKEDE